MKQTKQNIRRYVFMALFAALSYVTLYVIRIGGIGGFLTFDIKDAVLTVCAMLFGPAAGFSITLLVSLLEMVTVSGTGPLGFIMNFVSSAAFVVVGSMIYRYAPKFKKTLSGAILGLAASVVVRTIVMVLMNIWITPIYMKVPVQMVKDMMLPLLLPFNLIKAVLNAAIVLVLYKPLSNILKRAKAIDGLPESFRMDKKSICLLIAGIAVIVVCVLLLIFALKGQFRLFN